MPRHYLTIILPKCPKQLTWHSEAPVTVGARVRVRFQGRLSWGVVYASDTTPPDFATQPLTEVIDAPPLPASTLDTIAWLQRTYFSGWGAALSVCVPRILLESQHPLQRTQRYVRTSQPLPARLGPQQLAILQAIDSPTPLTQESFPSHLSRPSLRRLLQLQLVEPILGPPLLGFTPPATVRPSHPLSSAQATALATIQSAQSPTLLWGVTGSGKTEVYKKLIHARLEAFPDHQCVFLLPEIALTPQLTAEFIGAFGRRVAVWHSRLSKTQKIQIAHRLTIGDAPVLVGTRSALGVVRRPLSCLILDEEHEWTYQSGTMPRYSTHRLAAYLAQRDGATLVYGSATPRVESYHRAVTTQQWALARLSERVHPAPAPRIQLVDLRRPSGHGATPFNGLSTPLLQALRQCLDQGQQAVLFLNRRGAASAAQCTVCGQTCQCPRCASPLKVHGRTTHQRLMCHICSFISPFPRRCPHCSSSHFLLKGLGTQSVQRTLLAELPGVRVLRADADTTAAKGSFAQLTQQFDNYEADILLGTQMVTKGLDFKRVTLVGLLQADVGLSLPEFRASERITQLLYQVAGRAGRHGQPSQIIVQTYQPDHPLFQQFLSQDLTGFYQQTLTDRQRLGLTPFGAQGLVIISHRDKATCLRRAQSLARQCPAPPSARLDVAPAYTPRTHGLYHWRLILSAPDQLTVDQWFGQHAPTFQSQGLTLDPSPISLL